MHDAKSAVDVLCTTGQSSLDKRLHITVGNFQRWERSNPLAFVISKKNVSDKRKGQETIDKRVDVITKESHSAMKRS